MATVFVSGHLDLSEAEFQEHYAPRLEAAAAEGCDFVVGDARGADHRFQRLAAAEGWRVTVYHMFEAPRFNEGFPTRGGFDSDGARDEAMTQASDRDVAWVRPGREKSGTAKNLRRRGTAG